MATTDRFQIPMCGDTIELRLFNDNLIDNVTSVEKIDVYFYDPSLANTRLIETISTNITQESSNYLLELLASDAMYVIGEYKDVWSVNTDDGIKEITNYFKIYAVLNQGEINEESTDAPTDAPTEDTPTEDTPTEDTPTEDTPTEDTPTEDTP